jgi:hypothetical protein
MKALLVTALTCAMTITAAAADSPYIGTWVMNMEKSERDPAAPKLPFQKRTITYTEDASGLKAVLNTDGRVGTPVIYDGQERPISSASGAYTHAVATANGKTLQMQFKKDGKVVSTRKNSLSSDGRTMTAIVDSVEADGTKTHSVEVFEKR